LIEGAHKLQSDKIWRRSGGCRQHWSFKLSTSSFSLVHSWAYPPCRLDGCVPTMLETNVDLGDGLFVHRKSRVHLLTKRRALISCPDSDGSRSLAFPLPSKTTSQPARPWIARARAFHLLLRIYFSHDVSLTPTVLQDVDSILADLIETAEVSWTAPASLSRPHTSTTAVVAARI
jgi:hypothetical protein